MSSGFFNVPEIIILGRNSHNRSLHPYSGEPVK